MRKFIDQYEQNVGKSSEFKSSEDLSKTPLVIRPVRAIAYYLPQYHAVPENDKWWGAGFTEWTNVTKALPRFLGHRQPYLPADLGFYNLAHVETLRAQARLASRAGIFGFCFHNYWFSGKPLLERPLEILLQHKDIELSFCINWANESWSRRWDGGDSDILISQEYREGDDIEYIKSIIPALTDRRYIRIDGRPLIMVYRPSCVPDASAMFERWRAFLRQHGVGNPYLVMAHVFDEADPRPYGLDAVAGFPPHGGWNLANERDSMRLLDPAFSGHVVSYETLKHHLLKEDSRDFRAFPGVCPGWDNDARKPGRGFVLHGAKPSAYQAWFRLAAQRAMRFENPDERIVFINAWNEWAEGAYLEPDRHNGYANLVATRRVLDELTNHDANVSHEEYEPARPVSRQSIFGRRIYNRFRRRLHSSFRSRS